MIFDEIIFLEILENVVFNHEQWLKYWKIYTGESGGRLDIGALKPMRIAVFEGTLTACKKGRYYLSDGSTIVNLNKQELEFASKNTVMYTNGHFFTNRSQTKFKTNIR